MTAGFMKLNDEELKWLEGRVGTIDVQYGCPWQCIVCAREAPTYKGQMPYKDYAEISDSILEVKDTKGIDLLSESVFTFDRSDPGRYHSMDGEEKISIFHLTKDIIDRHHKKSILTLPGWHEEYIQAAISQIVERYMFGTNALEVTYSIKMVAEPTLREYDAFLRQGGNSTTEFIRNSRYFAKVLDNIKTLAPLHFQGLARYSAQALMPEHIRSLPDNYKKYAPILSDEFMIQFVNELKREWKRSPPRCGKNRNYEVPDFRLRSFIGVGRALNLGMPLHEKTFANMEIVSASRKRDMENYKKDNYSVQINFKGELEIYYGAQNSHHRILAPKEHFMVLAKDSILKKNKRKYEMIAGLQGKNILR